MRPSEVQHGHADIAHCFDTILEGPTKLRNGRRTPLSASSATITPWNDNGSRGTQSSQRPSWATGVDASASMVGPMSRCAQAVRMTGGHGGHDPAADRVADHHTSADLRHVHPGGQRVAQAVDTETIPAATAPAEPGKIGHPHRRVEPPSTVTVIVFPRPASGGQNDSRAALVGRVIGLSPIRTLEPRETQDVGEGHQERMRAVATAGSVGWLGAGSCSTVSSSPVTPAGSWNTTALGRRPMATAAVTPSVPIRHSW